MVCRPCSSLGDEDLCVADLTVRGEPAQRCRQRSRSSDAATPQDWRGSADEPVRPSWRTARGSCWGRRPKRAEKHVSVLDAILTPALGGLYEARLGKPIRVTRS